MNAQCLLSIEIPMTTAYTLDTNAIIYYAKDDAQATEKLDSIFTESSLIYLSTVSEIELFGFPQFAHEEEEKIEQFLRAVIILPLNSQIARIAGSLRKQFGIKTIDSAVAATALITRSTLLTRNIRDFKKIPNLSLQNI